MKYSVTQVVNGNYAVASEHDNIQSAIVNYFTICASLWNAPDVLDATIAILDENLDTYQGDRYKEHIHHDPVVVEQKAEEVVEESAEETTEEE